MKKNNLLRIFYITVFCIATLIICFYFFYLPNIKFYKPINITITGQSNGKLYPAKVYGVTPLGRKGLLDSVALSGANNKILLFSEILIDLDNIPLDSISEITVLHGYQKSIIGRNKIIDWHTKNRVTSLFPVSGFITSDNGTATYSGSFSHINSINFFDSLKLSVKLGFQAGVLYVANGFFLLFISIVFLLCTVLFPSFGIFLTLNNKPIDEYRIPYNPTLLSKQVFIVCLFTFVGMLVYNICYYKLFLLADTASDMMYYLSHDIFHSQLPGTYRFACILTNIILLPCTMLHLPMDVIGKIYSLNYGLFNLTIVVAILFFSRRYDLAAVVLAAPMLLLGINYYYLFNELFFSGSLMVLYIAIHQGIKDGILKKLILFPCLIYIIWNYPNSLMVLTVFLAGIYISPAQIIKDKWTVVFIAINLIARMLMLNDFDHSKIKDLMGGMDLNYLVHFIIDYCSTYWYLVILLIGGLYLSIARNNNIRSYTGLLIFPVALYFAMSRRLVIANVDYTKFIYPINLFILMQGTILFTFYYGKYKKWVLAFTCIILFSGIYTIISNYHTDFQNRVAVVEALNNMCIKEDPQHSKWFVIGDSINKIAPSISHLESLTFSAIQKLPINIHLVRGDQNLKKMIANIPEDQYYFFDNWWLNIKDLNPNYMHVKEGAYKELILDSTKLAQIRRVCE